MEDSLTDIKLSHITELFKHISLKAYSSKVTETKDEKIIDICTQLWKLDYKCEIVNNKNGSLCSTYPSRIVIPISDLDSDEDLSFSSPLSCSTQLESRFYNNNNNHCSLNHSLREQRNNSINSNADSEDHLLDRIVFQESFHLNSPLTFSAVVAGTPTKHDLIGRSKGLVNGSSILKLPLREYFSRANLARCRYRFPIPSILCKGKYVSRSATLSCFMEVIGKQFLHSSDNSHFLDDIGEELIPAVKPSNDVDRARFYDIKLLEVIGTSSIFDLMVENKKVKYSMNISSSEKADKENRYSQFSIVSIPYPGCEFFRELTERNMNSADLYYNWDPQFNNAALSLVDEVISGKVANDWHKYKSWDLRKMTANYLKLILRYITDEDSDETGFLVHCISGWDRTPLFISLIRLSLWADGLVHSSLNAKQMLYFTLAYDWYLFGHQLPDRLKLKENILYFCFEFLDEIYKDNFMDAIDRRENSSSTESFVSATYESCTVGDTPVSSFESLSSSSSSNHPTNSGHSSSSSKHHNSRPIIPPNPNPCEVSSQGNGGETSSWPFDKENGFFSFDGIRENSSSHSRGRSAKPENGEVSSKVSPSRNALKERKTYSCPRIVSNASPAAPASSPAPVPSSLKYSGVAGRGFSNSSVNVFTRDGLWSSGRRRKISSVEPPFKSVNADSDSTDSNQTESSVEELGENFRGMASSFQLASKPVPVPLTNERSRHSSASSAGSWQLLSSSDIYKEPASTENHKSSRTSLLADMVDSTLTIKEETTPCSSLDSCQSIIVFNRQRRLSEVREMFLKIYGEGVAGLYPEVSLFSDLVQNICQKLGS